MFTRIWNRWVVVAHYEGLQEPMDSWPLRWMAKMSMRAYMRGDMEDLSVVYSVQPVVATCVAQELGQFR